MNPNLPPQPELPYENQADGRMALDPMAAIEAAQAAAAERERQATLRQSTEAFVGDLENPDMEAVADLRDMQDQRAKHHETETALAESRGMNSHRRHETTEQGIVHQYGSHYEDTVNQGENESNSSRHRDDLLDRWARADVIGDQTTANDVQDELLDRVMNMKHVDDREKQRMLDAQVKSMQARQEAFLTDVNPDEFAGTADEKAVIAARKKELEDRKAESARVDSKLNPTSRIDSLSDTDIRDLDPSMMEDMTDAERDAYFARLHALKGQDHLDAPREDRQTRMGHHGKKDDIDSRRGGAAEPDEGDPFAGLPPVPPLPPRRPAGEPPRPFPRRTDDGTGTGVYPVRLPSRPLPRTPEPASQPGEGDQGGDQGEQARTGRRLAWLGRVGIGSWRPLAGRYGAQEQGPQLEEVAIPAVPGVGNDDFDLRRRGAMPDVDADPGRSGTPELAEPSIAAPVPDEQGNGFTRWYAGVPRGNSWDERSSVLRGARRLPGRIARGVLTDAEVQAPEGAVPEPGDVRVAGRPVNRRRPVPQVRPQGEARDLGRQGLDILEEDDES